MWEIVIFIATIILAIMIVKKLPVDLETDDRASELAGEKSLRDLADEYIEQEKFSKAEDILLKLISQDPTDAAIYNKLGMIYLRQKDFRDAQAALKQALKLEPENDTFYNNLGLLYYQKGDYEAAIDAYEKSLEISDKVPSRLVNLGLAYFMIKKYRKAADNYEKALILDSRNQNYVELLRQAEEKLK